MMGRGLAKLLDAPRRRQNSNEVTWKGAAAVIKSCAPATDQIGVTITMLPRLTYILAGFEDDKGQVQVWELDAAKFRAAMYDSRSQAGPKLQMVRRRYAEKEGRPVARFNIAAIRAAAG
jgi:hypothetical protein